MQSIVTIADIERRARRDFERGVPATECPFPWHSAAYNTWHTTYTDLLLAQAAARHAPRLATEAV